MIKGTDSGRTKPPVFFPGMGSPMENEIRRVEFDAQSVQIRAQKKGHRA